MNTNKGPLWTLAKDRTRTLRWWTKQRTTINIGVMSTNKRPQWTQMQWTFQQHLDSFNNNGLEDHEEHCTIESWRKYWSYLIRSTIGAFDRHHGVKWVNLLWAQNIHTHKDTTMPFIVFKLIIFGTTTIPPLLIYKPYF